MQAPKPGELRLRAAWRYCGRFQRGGQVNKSELIDILAGRAEISRPKAARVVELLFGANGLIASELRRGGRVQITGFGTFVARRRPARIGRDPRTGAPIPIKAALTPLFRAGQALKDSLNRRR
jgi:DNA-binding protein HU-beta